MEEAEVDNGLDNAVDLLTFQPGTTNLEQIREYQILLQCHL